MIFIMNRLYKEFRIATDASSNMRRYCRREALCTFSNYICQGLFLVFFFNRDNHVFFLAFSQFYLTVSVQMVR